MWPSSPHQRVWIKRGDTSYIFMLCIAVVYTFNFPNVTLCKGQVVHDKFPYFSSILLGLFWIEY